MDSHIEELLESELKDQEYPDFDSGDTIRVQTREEIGGQMRDREFEGVCISRSGKGPDQTFKVRKDSFGVGVERIFPLYSPMIQEIEVVRKGKVRRAKLNYLEDRSSKESRIEEKRVDLDEVNDVGEESTDESSGDTAETEADEQAEDPDDEETPEDEATDAEAESVSDDQDEDTESASDEGAESDDEEDTEASETAEDDTSDDENAEEASDQEDTDEDPTSEKEEVGESV
jgi:large subunit ribosomal protein L19